MNIPSAVQSHTPESGAVLSLLLSGLEEMLLLIDRDLTIRFINDAAATEIQKKYGFTVSTGMPFLLLVQNTERKTFMEEIFAHVFNGGEFETDIQAPDGSASIYHYHIRPAKDSTGEIIVAIMTVHDVTEKRITESALKKSEERLRFAMEGSNHGIWDWNIKTGEIFFSSSWKKMLGFEEEEIINSIREWEKRIHPEDKEQLARDLKSHYDSDKPIYENSYRLLGKDNRYRYIQGRGKIVERDPNGTPLRMIGTHTDITAKRESETQYRELFDSNPLPTWIYDYETLQILTVNKAAMNHYGFSREEFLSKTIFDLHQPEQHALLQERINYRDKASTTQYPNWKHVKKNGELIIVDINGTTIQYNGRKARLIVANDITEKVSVEEELRRGNTRYQYVTKATSDAIYDLDVKTGHLSWGEGLYSLFGHKSLESTLHEWERFIHPDDYKTVTESLYKTMYDCRKKLWTMEYRFLKHDGTYRHVIEKAFIIRDAADNPLRMIGAIQDITNLKEKQLELTKSNQRYEFATLAVSDIIWDWDLKTNDVLYSDNYEKILGWKLPQSKMLQFQKCIEKVHPEDYEWVVKNLNAALQDKHRTLWDAEFRYLKADNEFAFVYDRAFIIRNSDGVAVRMIGAIQDITQRKQLEEQLLQKELDKQKVISKATIDTQEKERSEIGKELHDNVNQVLTTTKLYLELALSNAELKDELLQKSQTNIMYVINEIRQLSRSLMNPTLGDLGFIDSVNDLVENISATRKLNVIFKADKVIASPVYESLHLTLYRIIQEALNNAVKHAQATSVSVCITRKKNLLELSIRDNGIGFIPDATKKGAGLKSIQNRVYLANGKLLIQSKPGEGCVIISRFSL